LLRGDFLIQGLSNRRLRAVLPGKTAGQIAHILRRLRQHGLLKKVGGTYRYYLSELGRRLLVAARRVSEHVILPALQPQST
jgi:DNA-binding HxlR family transcriptional regulator